MSRDVSARCLDSRHRLWAAPHRYGRHIAVMGLWSGGQAIRMAGLVLMPIRRSSIFIALTWGGISVGERIVW